MLLFAYDGSINGDWVSHYAIQLAAAHPDARLRLLHVHDGSLPRAMLGEKLERMRAEAARQGVELDPRLIPLGPGGLLETLRAAAPSGPDHYLVCGTRPDARQRPLLAGTIPERLMRARHCNLLAIRVLHPGLLGAPRRLLLPITERLDDFSAGLPFLRLFAPQVSHLHIVLVARVRRRRLRRLSHGRAEYLRARAQAQCERIERAIVETLGLGAKVMDAQVVVSDEIPREILVAAARTKSRLIYLSPPAPSLRERFFRADPLEQVLREATCDVAVYQGIA